MSVPVVGLRFRHRRVLAADGTPALYTVTAMRRGTVYYRQDGETRSRECTGIDEFDRVFLEPA